MTAKILVAGVGNIFLGDDGFGVEVARVAQQAATTRERDGQGFWYPGFRSGVRSARSMGRGHHRGCAAARRSCRARSTWWNRICSLARRVGGHGDQSARHGSSAGTEPGCFPWARFPHRCWSWAANRRTLAMSWKGAWAYHRRYRLRWKRRPIWCGAGRPHCYHEANELQCSYRQWRGDI